MVPILDYVAEDGSRVVMPESMDIVKRIDEDGRFGAPILKVGFPQATEGIREVLHDACVLRLSTARV